MQPQVAIILFLSEIYKYINLKEKLRGLSIFSPTRYDNQTANNGGIGCSNCCR